MAEIDVVKKSSHTWVWVLIVLVVLIAAYFMFGRSPEPRTGSVNTYGGQPLAAALAILPAQAAA